MADHLEIEQKFDVDADFKLPDFAEVNAGLGQEAGAVTAAAPVLHLLSATYFDTADGRLAASKITLRRRFGGSDEGWHLKLPGQPRPAADARLPAGVSARVEVHAPLDAAPAGDGGAPVVPERLAARVAEVTGGLPLGPIATLDTERTVVTLTGRDGRPLAEIADDAVTARRVQGASSGAPLRWREIEVEVPSPAPELQRAAADLLFAAGARPAGHGSKLARLLNS
jgi:inorganic triphosphatase YgiF